jgi:hypothetical protein
VDEKPASDPLVVYHGTREAFEAFEVGDVGYHFGTLEQAQNRINVQMYLEQYLKAPTLPLAAAADNLMTYHYLSGINVIPAYIRLTNPLKVDRDFIAWDARQFLQALPKDFFTENEKSELYKVAAITAQEAAVWSDRAGESRVRFSHLNFAYGSGSIKEEYATVRRILQNKGYDGIIYPNSVEGSGNSYIVFDPTQIKSVYNVGTWNPRDPRISFAVRKTPNPEGRSQIIKDLSKAFDLPIRVGKFRSAVGGGRKRLGIYKSPTRVIRILTPNDVETVIHEIGHDLQRLLHLMGDMPTEIQAMAYPGAKDVHAEGFAEFVRNYVTQPTNARALAPDFYSLFETTLAEHPDVQKVLLKARTAWKILRASNASDLLGSYLRYGAETKSHHLPSFDEIYTNVIDELHPLKILRDFAVKQRGGQAFRPSEDVFTLAWMLRGWARKAEQYLKWGTFQIDPVGKSGVKLTGASLRTILAPIEKAGEIHLLDRYLTAKRAVNDPRIVKGFNGQITQE